VQLSATKMWTQEQPRVQVILSKLSWYLHNSTCVDIKVTQTFYDILFINWLLIDFCG
jgi:hypothetical protein